ncbi:phosphate ABC transporter, inner membrane subunit PstC [Methanohalobium evestigatum Z-7303]|uniref:Phosphate transport system permease protein n=1 Tax=Methanohalobium evestigatum (strain ATCC BAA-1072 / DSM 3721 / NBRC 107634 / OCM 161 / Z-7303) TaxID=644295 RepID=D7E5V3_METEZ|nr:phosphate ABC transporter permease subunit PstC [Methanohalobium evestigatum]ADI72975.1 phosphate ABC transporter, inner membrane subunit PstC [Methanohalobium evestigatum Z-7303]
MDNRLKIKRSNPKVLKERAIKSALFSCAFVSLLVTILIIATLLGDAINFFTEVSIVEFLTGTNWSPSMKPYSFGVLPLVTGTLMITVISAAVAIPLGVATSVYLSEYADKKVRKVVKPVLEVLAGIPTVVYGFFALTFITPVLQTIFPEISLYNALSAGIVVGIMILPMISSLSEDAMSSVPDDLRDGGYALGASKFNVTTGIVVPASISGILSSFILGISRAIGETMAVTIAAGRLANMSLDPLKSIETMTAAMVEVAEGDIAAGTAAYDSLFAIGLLLFVITLAMNMVSQYLKSRYKEKY